MLETVTTCPVCSNGQFEPFLTCTDQLVTKQQFRIQECQQCKFRFTNPRPDASLIGSYYKSEQYISHNDTGQGIINTIYRLVRSYTLRSKLNLINSLNKGTGYLLDVGCGTGAFLETCQRGGWKIKGTEPDANARALTMHKLKTGIEKDLIDVVENNTYNIITLWHVLEHILDINKTIEHLHSLLSEQGHLVVAVPNCDSYDAHYFKEYWAAYDVPRHLHHFTPFTIESLFSKRGFELIEQKPMNFDAIYIALLSTRYQSGRTDYLKSIRIGLLSNIKALRTGNTSSVVYVFRKAQSH